MKSNNLILFVFEGKKEKSIAGSFKEYFSDSYRIVECAYCTTIYSLYRKISDDGDLSLFGILKEIVGNEHLRRYKSKQFAEIYLFFDYDGHSSNADDNKLKDAIQYFNEETDYGKLYISFPMVEALKHYDYDDEKFKNLRVSCKENISYKKIVNRECNEAFIDFNRYENNIWVILIKLHIKKMNFIVNDNFSIPNSLIPQIEIFQSQLKKYINVDCSVSVLSAFPMFLFDYFGRIETIEKNFESR